MKNEHHCHKDEKNNTINRRLKLSCVLFLSLLTVSFYPHPLFVPLNNSLLTYLQLIWLPVLVGFLLGGIIDYFVPREFINGLLGGSSVRSVLVAVLAGFLLSACSHGILALAIQLYKKGASTAATITFLLASPWANFPVTILLFSFFGWKALLFVFGAMVVAISTGSIFLLLEKYGVIESSSSPKDNTSADWERIKKLNVRASMRGIYFGAISLANMVLWWIIIGVIIAAFLGAYVPEHFVHSYFGASFGGLVTTLLAATVIEVCSEGSSPIAFEIFNQVGTLGNPFVFLMAGVVTDFTEIGLLWTNIGKRTAIFLPLVTVPQVLVLGYIFNMI